MYEPGCLTPAFFSKRKPTTVAFLKHGFCLFRSFLEKGNNTLKEQGSRTRAWVRACEVTWVVLHECTRVLQFFLGGSQPHCWYSLRPKRGGVDFGRAHPQPHCVLGRGPLPMLCGEWNQTDWCLNCQSGRQGFLVWHSEPPSETVRVPSVTPNRRRLPTAVRYPPIPAGCAPPAARHLPSPPVPLQPLSVTLQSPTDWADTDAFVVCQSLGYSGGTAREGGAFGEGSGEIWLSNVNCSGTERDVTECPHGGWGGHDCLHKEDAGVVCGPAGACAVPRPSFVGPLLPGGLYVSVAWGCGVMTRC